MGDTLSGVVNSRKIYRNTYGNSGIGSFGVGNPHLRDEFGVNHREIYRYGKRGIGNFGSREYAPRGVNLAVHHRNTYGNMGSR